MILSLLAVGMTAFAFTSVTPNNSINKYYNQGLSDVVYSYQLQGDDDVTSDDVLYTIPNNFSGSLEMNTLFSSDSGYVEYGDYNNRQQFISDYDVGNNAELKQTLIASRNDFYVSRSNPSYQGFTLSHNNYPHSVSYSMDIQYEYLIEGYMTENTWYNAVVYRDTLTLSGTQSSGVVYPISWFIDNLNIDPTTTYDLIHIRSFTMIMTASYSSTSSFEASFMIENDYSTSDLQLLYSDNWFSTYSQGVSVEPLPVVDFTEWISTAIGGFWNFWIIPGVSIGVIFSTIVALVIIVLILKMFLGG